MSRLETINQLLNDPANYDKIDERLKHCPYQAKMITKAGPCHLTLEYDIYCSACPTDDTVIFNNLLRNISDE